MLLRGVPRAKLGQATGVPGAHEQDVALPDLHFLLARRGLEILAKHMLAGLQPRHTARTGNVQQHAATDEAVLDERDRLVRGAVVGDGVGRDAVVQATLVGDMAQRVDVRVAIAVVVDSDEVLRKTERA